MTQPKILKFATGNENKLREARQILWIPLEKAEVGDLDEIQTTDVEELIRHKARGAYEIMGEPVMVEDTGLAFTAWNGLPGALIKWFLQTVNNEWLLKMLEWYTDRRAEAICYIASFDGESYTIASGRVSGTIATECRGETLFGWDKIFIPNDHSKTFAEMTPEEKNSISMRKLAFENYLRLIEKK